MAAVAEKLNSFLASNSYLGDDAGATKEDYRVCASIQSVDSNAHPHLARWHAHVTYLMAKHPTYDYRGSAVLAGKDRVGAGAAAPAAASPKQKAAASPKQKPASPKQSPKSSPKQKAAPAPKKEAPAKKEAAAKKEGGKKEAAPEVSPEEARKKQLKKCLKEGGKRGVEIEGAADMGGLQFFCTSVDEPDGDLEMVVECMNAMNAKSDPTDEERKGGSGNIGKMIFSAGTEHLAVVAYVPEAKQAECDCAAWLKQVLSIFGGELVTGDKTVSVGKVKADGDKNIFPLKIREPMILEANNFLRKLGLFPEDNGSDDDEMVFGDDDFPSM